MARTKVTISLIREGIENINEIVQIDKCEHQEINGVGVFFYKRSAPQSPSWLGFFEGLLQEEQLCNSFAQGLLVVSRTTVDGNRFFAISFGYGRNLLQPNIIDSRFGLITALNSIDEKQLRSLDINTLESVPKIDRVQSSRLTEMNEFDVDQERDLLRSVTGKTSTAMKDHFGNTVTGASSLNISTEKTITNIGDLLDICYH